MPEEGTMRGLGLALNVSLDKVGAAGWPNLNLVFGTLVKAEGESNPSSSPLSPTHVPAVAWEPFFVTCERARGSTPSNKTHRFLRCKTEVWQRGAGPGRSA
ncbi:hypothetical protein ACRRTK_009666 [Alexandromys fortis]